MPRTLMEQALILPLFSAHHAALALPSDLNHLTVFDKHRHGALSARKRAQAIAGIAIRFHVVLDEFGATPLEPFTHFLRVRASRGAEEFELTHEPKPPAFRESRDRPRPALPGSAGCNPNGQRLGNRQARAAGFRRHRNRAKLR